MSGGPPIALRRHDGPEHRFEIATRAPAAALAGLVRGYVGYTEHAAHAVRRLRVPFFVSPSNHGGSHPCQTSTSRASERSSGFVERGTGLC